MSPRARRTAIAVAVVVVVLFAGRWTAGFLADRWWGATISPEAAEFLTDFNLLRLVLDATGVLLGAAWFTGHLLLVYRAIGSVEISRRIANLEVRERLTPQMLMAGAVAAGLLLGLLAGGDLSRNWQTVALAWRGVHFGLADPVLANDAGLYLAQLPFWSMVYDFAHLLALSALVLVVLFYALVGALRWIDGRPAINDHARRHVGWLLAGFALVLAVGALLDPLRRVGGVAGVPGAASLRVGQFVAPLLAVACLIAALLSAFWAHRSRHVTIAVGWSILLLAWLLGRGVATALVEPEDVPAGTAEFRSEANATAYAIRPIEGALLASTSASPPPANPAYWQPDQLLLASPADSSSPATLDAAWVGLGGGAQRPAWLVVRQRAGEPPRVEAVADDELSRIGTPLYYQAADTIAERTAASFTPLSSHALHPSTDPQALDSISGIVAGRWPRRLLLAWALQRGDLLGETPPTARIAWERRPVDRLRKLAPFGSWGRPVPRIVNSRLLWISDGHLTGAYFPLSARVSFQGENVGYLRAAFVGVVDAESGGTHIYLRPDAGPVAQAWASFAGAVLEPWSALDPAVRPFIAYPADVFRVQARLLESAETGRLVGSADSAGRTTSLHELLWDRTLHAPVRLAAYVAGSPARIQTVLLGRSEAGAPVLVVRRPEDSSTSLGAPDVLQRQWTRFPSFTQVADSARRAGGTLVAGNVRLWLAGDALGAFQVWYAPLQDGSSAVAWVSLAWGGRVGAGRTMEEAWSNLSGRSVPAPPGVSADAVLIEARRWLRQADSALRAGDLGRFGRAFDVLRQLLESRSPPPR